MSLMQPTGVLDGVRILELARWQAAPRGGMILRDMGADVIKVEWSKSSDLRNSGPFVGEMSVQFAAYNRGKKSVTFDLRQPDAVRIVHEIAATSDIVVNHWRVGVLERLGFGYTQPKAIKPDIIFVTASTFGPNGP